ncbi:hypothetical protein [Corynebacterium matruchotii]|nr:hypothetical protein [Corynebacterium matruchotii]
MRENYATRLPQNCCKTPRWGGGAAAVSAGQTVVVCGGVASTSWGGQGG